MSRVLTAPATTRWSAAATLATCAVLVCAATAVPTSAGASPGAPSGTRSAIRPGSHSDFAGGKWGDATADNAAKDAYGRNAAQDDPGSLYTVEKVTGARGVWGRRALLSLKNLTGQGVGVALLDSGVTRVPGLNAPGKVTYGPDLSVEGNGPLADQDTFGHGTFMAGIIAGRGADNPSSDLASAPADIQLGVAPDANLLSVKLATGDGSTDVSEVIAALDWVTQHPVMPNGTRIRVINLSYGTDSQQDYRSDPLAAAAENAWRHGIVVVTSAGNDGNHSDGMTDPAIDPYVLAVGAADSADRKEWDNKTTVASFSSVGDGVRNPDLVAPGRSIVSLRTNGSTIDDNNPQGKVSGDTSGRLFRGSGSSQAAAVVSGAVALLLQAYPNLTPDQVKAALVQSAKPITGTRVQVGAGLLNVAGALDTAGKLSLTDKVAALLNASAKQSFPISTGQGSIEAARGGSELVDADGNALSGEIDVQGNAWDPAAWWAASSSLASWDNGKWLGVTWTGDGWENTDSSGLASARWSSARWSSARWSDADWSSARWSSARWSSARWSSARWSSARWSADDW